jgi:hypothetical protein
VGASIVLLEFELFWSGCMWENLAWYSPKRDFWDILLLVALQLLKDMESWVQLWLLQVRTFHVCVDLREQFNSFVFPCCFVEHENKKTILLFDAIKIWKYLVSSSSSFSPSSCYSLSMVRMLTRFIVLSWVLEYHKEEKQRTLSIS